MDFSKKRHKVSSVYVIAFSYPIEQNYWMKPITPSHELLHIASLARVQLHHEFMRLTQVPLSTRHAVDTHGVYAIYYRGLSPLYTPLLRPPLLETPIYVGVTVGALDKRLKEHQCSLISAGFDIDDFECRILPTPADLAKSAEDMLLRQYKPIWNTILSGFGLHNPGAGRRAGRTSAWDHLHPGRPWITTTLDQHEVDRLQQLVRTHLQELCATMKTSQKQPSISCGSTTPCAVALAARPGFPLP